MQIEISDPDRNIDYTLSVEPYNDDAGRYQEPNAVVLESFVVWFGKWGCAGAPETNIEANRAGEDIARRFGAEIDSAVRREIEKRMEAA